MIAPGLPPTPEHDLIFHGGKIIQDLTFTNLYVGGAQAWDPGNMRNIDSALAAAMSDADLNNVMMQYFANQPITSVFQPSQVLPGPRPATVSKANVEALIARLYAQGQLDGSDLSTTLFNLMLPSGTVLTTDGGSGGAAAKASRRRALPSPIPAGETESSLEGLGGFHGSVHTSDGATVYYAVGVFSEVLPDGRTNGIVAFDAPWKNVVATFYHELNEVRTDPDVEDAINAGNDPAATRFLGWVSQQGEECGDFPIFEAEPNLGLVMQEVALTDGRGSVPVQFQYSNAVHGPEGPIPAPHRAARGRRP